MVVAIVALIMLFIFMSYPWYSINYNATTTEPTKFELDYNLEYGLEDITVEAKSGEFTYENTTSYDEAEIKDDFEEVKEVMDNVYLLHLITMILLVIAIIVIPIAAIGKIPHASGMVILVIAIIMVLIIPIYFFFSFPPAVETQFEGMTDMGDPMNETFIYNGEFLSSGRGTWYSEDNDKWSYTQEWGPGLAFWFIFVPLITIVVAQVVYASGKADLSPVNKRPPRDHHDRPMPPPRGDRSRPPPRDYGPPRPMRDEDYDRYPASRGPPPGRDDYGFQEPPPSRRRGGDYDYDSRPPPPRPPRRRDGY
jgi:hypothetical protein